jgi:hypothetical protein
MKNLLPSIIICFGLILLGLTQRYDFNGDYRIDKLTGQLEECRKWEVEENIVEIIDEIPRKCYVKVKGKGIFKYF